MLCRRLSQGPDCFETRGIKLKEKKMVYEFGFNYLSTKIAFIFQLKNQFSIYPEVT